LYFIPKPNLYLGILQTFGQSKSDKTIHYIANYLRDYDIIAVQELQAMAVCKLLGYPTN
jgi:hypothetical protein